MEESIALHADVKAYLKRIGCEELGERDKATLFNLQDAHLHSVPYENLDILNRIPLSLEIKDLINKVVYRQRGGYCFELNAVFGWLLRQLGYAVTDHVARFWRNEQTPPPKRRHQVLKVMIDQQAYLCDVGVGGIVPRMPIQMTEGLEQKQGEECYKLEKHTEYGWMLLEHKNENWQPIYSFTEEPQYTKDFIMPSFWCEHAEDSIFRQQAMLAIRTRDGRNTVAGKEFRIFHADGVRVFTPENDEAYRQALQQYFYINLAKEGDHSC